MRVGPPPEKNLNTGVDAIFCSPVPFNQRSVHLHKVQIGRLVGRGYLPLPTNVTTVAYKTWLFICISNGAGGKACSTVFMTRETRVRVSLLPKSVFSLFTSLITSERHLFGGSRDPSTVMQA